MVQGQKQMMECIPDISTLLRVGHFYFALTEMQKKWCKKNRVVLLQRRKARSVTDQQST